MVFLLIVSAPTGIPWILSVSKYHPKSWWTSPIGIYARDPSKPPRCAHDLPRHAGVLGVSWKLPRCAQDPSRRAQDPPRRTPDLPRSSPKVLRNWRGSTRHEPSSTSSVTPSIWMTQRYCNRCPATALQPCETGHAGAECDGDAGNTMDGWSNRKTRSIQITF